MHSMFTLGQTIIISLLLNQRVMNIDCYCGMCYIAIVAVALSLAFPTPRFLSLAYEKSKKILELERLGMRL